MAWAQPQQASYNLGKPNAAPRPKNLHCDICNKDFTANSDRDAHMAGTKHAKAVKSQQIITELKEKIPAATGINSMFRCATCDITLNSSQQLATHLSGSRHKLKEKMTKGGAGGGIVLADKQEVMAQAAAGLKVTAVGVGGTTAAVPTAVSTAAVPTPATSTTATNAAAAAPEANGAAAKPKTPAEKAAKPPVQTFKCVVCDVDLNSESQRDQHLNSKKHADKMAGRTVSTSRGFGLGFRGRGTPFSTRDRGGRGSSFSNGDRGRGGRGRAPNTRGGGFSPGRGRGFSGSGGTGFGGSGGTGFGGSGGGGTGFGGSSGSSGFGSGSGGGFGSSGGFGSGGSSSGGSFGSQVGIGRGRAAGTPWIGSGGGYATPSGSSGGNVKLEGSGDSSYGYQGYGYSGGGTGGADSSFGGGVKMETGDQGDFFSDDGQFGSSMPAFSSGCAQTAGGGSGGGGEFNSPGGPVFRGRGQTHASLPYSRPPPLPTGPPPQQPPPPAY